MTFLQKFYLRYKYSESYASYKLRKARRSSCKAVVNLVRSNENLCPTTMAKFSALECHENPFSCSGGVSYIHMTGILTDVFLCPVYRCFIQICSIF